jgi:hypothetical protein
MMNKLLGYIISFIGIVIIAIGSLPPLRTAIKVIPASIKDLYLMFAGLIIVIVGIIFLTGFGSSSSSKVKEVPIYQGKDVVGFRRIGKK